MYDLCKNYVNTYSYILWFANLTIIYHYSYDRYMDPKQLDPKLQEAYNRVMGVNLTAPTNSSTPTDTPSVPANPVAQQDPTTPAMPPTPQDQTAIPNPAPAAPVMPSPVVTPDPTAAPVVPMADPTTPAEPAPSEEKPAEAPTVETAMPSMESTVSTKPHAFVAKGNGMKVSPVIIAVGGIAFLLIYSLVWIKVFNLSIPFINQ